MNLVDNFVGRGEKLKGIYRYSIFDTVFYRNNLSTHSQRVSLLVDSVSDVIKRVFPDFDLERAKTLALVHDDAEMETGDIQLGHKDKMSDQELKDIDLKEEMAINVLSEKFPEEINRFNYKELLLDSLNKTTIESQVVSFMDKLDSACESYHEIFAGNKSFIDGAGGARPPLVIYKDTFDNFTKKYPALGEFYPNDDHPLLKEFVEIDEEQACREGGPHTEESLGVDTGIPQYEFWKKLTLEKMENGLLLLAEKRE